MLGNVPPREAGCAFPSMSSSATYDVVTGAAVADGPGPQGGEVGAGGGLGEDLRPDLLPPQHRRDVAGLLRFAAVGQQRRPAHAEPDGEHARGQLVAARLLVEDVFVAGRPTAAA